MSVDEMRAGLRDLILEGLRAKYMSESCQDAIQTGNHYQSVTLGGEVTKGFRTDRAEFLDRLDFRGRKVLDLGSNLGEMSRGARARGARLVDGFEYDPYFIELADLVSAHNEITRVSFHQRDITDRAIYGERYDIVLAFSVFVYIDKVLDRLADVTDVLVIETHKLVGNLEETYLEPVGKYFPARRLLGDTEWGTEKDQSVKRAVIAFAKTEEALADVLIDAPTDAPAAAAAPRPSADPRAAAVSDQVDVERTCLQQRFFERYGGRDPDDLLRAVAQEPLDLERLAATHDAREYAYSGWTYWFLFLRGWLQHREEAALGPGNVYLDYLIRHFGPQMHDPGLSREIEDPLAAIVTVGRRFRDLEHYRSGATTDSGYEPAPVRLIVSDPSPPDAPEVATLDHGVLHPRNIDGWHRLFAARLFGVDAVPCQVIRADARPGAVLAEVERVSRERDALTIEGWCVSPSLRTHSVEARVDGTSLARANVQPREDVASWFDRIPHARESGFVLEVPLEPQEPIPAALDLAPLNGWIPTGRMPIPALLERLPEVPLPPATIVSRLMGTSDPRTAAIRGARALAPVLAALASHGADADLGDVLVWGADRALIQPLLALAAPGARVVGAGFDAEAVDWLRANAGAAERVAADPPTDLADEGFDVVIGCSTLPGLPRERQLRWLAELHRVTRRGGLVALSFQGELLRSFLPPEVDSQLDPVGLVEWPREQRPGWPHARVFQTRGFTVSICSDWFDAVEYAQGVVADSEDLLVLRKP